MVERPKATQVRVLLDFGGNMELLNLAESITAADLWIAREGYRNARLEIVGESGARQSYLQMGRRIPHMRGGERRGAQVCYFHRPQVRVNVQTARPLIGCAQNHRSGIWIAILPHRGQCRVARRGMPVMNAARKPSPDLRMQLGQISRPRVGVIGNL